MTVRISSVDFGAARLASRARWAFSARRVPQEAVAGLLPDVAAARPGDLVLARVLKIGHHKNIQLTEGRPAALSEGDLIVMPCGARYAADQFEGEAVIDPEGVDMLAGGGVLGRMLSRHEKTGAPTRVLPLSLLAGRDGAALNLAAFALAPRSRPAGLAAICVVGASMNAGKTATTASLAHGLAAAGRRVAAIKATGTGSFGDLHAYRDAGAHVVLDFTDCGMASTWRERPAKLLAALDTLLAEAARLGCDAAVVEFADGILQQETAALLADPAARGAFGGFLFACGCSLSALGGVSALAANGIRPLALSGLVARSPLLAAEAKAASGLPVLNLADLRDPMEAAALIRRAEGEGRAAA